MDNISSDEYEKIKNNPVELFSETSNVGTRENRERLLIEINREKNIDVCEGAIKAIENGQDASWINSFMEDIMGELKLNKESLLRYFRIIDQSFRGSLFGSTQYSQIQDITTKQPVFAEEFLEYLMLSDEPIVFQYIVEIILHLNQFDLEEKHTRLLVMANSYIELKIMCGINGLGRIKYPDDKHELFTKTLSCFDSLIKQESHIINGAITKSLGFLYLFGEKVISRLMDLSKRDDPYILVEIAQFLDFKFKKVCNEKYFKGFLFSLTKVNSKCIGIIKEMDMLLYSMINAECNIDMVFDFLLKWMDDSDCKPGKIISLQLLDMTFSGICLKTNSLQKTLLLFNNDNIYAPQLAGHIIFSKGLSKDKNICFEADSITSLNVTDILFMCRRILGYVIQPEITISLLYSMLSAKKGDKETLDLLCSCFDEYIGYNYPKTTIDFFEGILDDNKLDDSIKNIVSNILEKTKVIYKERKEKHKLKELEPSRKDLYILYKDEWQNNQKAIELAEKKSVMNSLVTKSHIKYGKATSYHVGENFTEPQPFECFSFSVEFPYDFQVDPVGIDMCRYNFRNARRGEN